MATFTNGVVLPREGRRLRRLCGDPSNQQEETEEEFCTGQGLSKLMEMETRTGRFDSSSKTAAAAEVRGPDSTGLRSFFCKSRGENP